MIKNKQECRIKHFPISFFSIILGLAGFTIAFQKIEWILDWKIYISQIILIITLTIFLVLTIIYALKILFFWKEIKDEFNNPIKLSFFPTFSISLLLLSIAIMPLNLILSEIIWLVGTVIHFTGTLKIVSIWIHHTKFEITHMNPAWFIPAVGNILVPIVGSHLGFFEISWFFYSIGLFFWIILLIIFFNRIIFHSPLSEKLLPTMFILIAPPAVGFISLTKLTGDIGDFHKILYYFSFFLTILLFLQINIFKKIKFYLSWWAYSFPISAITIATVLMFQKTKIIVFKYISLFLFMILVLMIIILISKTIKAILEKNICIEEK